MTTMTMMTMAMAMTKTMTKRMIDDDNDIVYYCLTCYQYRLCDSCAVTLPPLAAGTFFGVQAVFSLLTGSLGFFACSWPSPCLTPDN